MQATQKKKEAQGRNQEIPAYLIYEVLEGKPVYYKGYKEVLAENKILEDIMGSSGLQAEIVSYLLKICYLAIDTGLFRIFTNEVGSHIDKGNNLSNDIAIFDKAAFSALAEQARANLSS